ncbi:MAG: GTP-binding protein, partial [Gammaproteobacteria bacterium]|nr:GTP-binding protein [Gammaproteobacteria bacterium]
LDSLRDSAVFVLVDRKLDKAETRFKQEQAEKIVKTYTKRAIFGAMAAVAPGSDLLIQGYLGKQMVNEISAVYDIEARKVDVQTFLELVEQHLQKALPVVLAIAGNGLKAFPGIGTITGGIAHAGAYGLIFDALGRSLSASMAVRGTLSPAPAATQFKDYLNENLALGTRRFAQLVLEARKENRSD